MEELGRYLVVLKQVEQVLDNFIMYSPNILSMYMKHTGHPYL